MERPVEPACEEALVEEIVNAKGRFTVNWNGAAAETAPLTPVTVSEYAPGGTPSATVTVKVVVNVPAGKRFVANVAAMPVGQPGPCESVTGPLK